MNKTIKGILHDLEKPDEYNGIKYFFDKGGFDSDWFRALSDSTQFYYQMMYWNTSNACFSEDPFPEARLTLLGNDSDVLWEKIDLNDIKAVYQEFLDCWKTHSELKPLGFKDFALLTEQIKNRNKINT